MAVVALRRTLLLSHRSAPPFRPVASSVSAEHERLLESHRNSAPAAPPPRDCTGNGISVGHYELSSRTLLTRALPRSNYGYYTVLGAHPQTSLNITGACFSTEIVKDGGNPIDSVQELYQKMVSSVEAKTMPPNAWLWSLINNCGNKEDIVLLFQILEKLRIFRLSSLQIYENFNSNLCMRIAEACARVGAIDYGMKALRKHNIYGLTPNIGSVHYLLSYAKRHNDVDATKKIMNHVRKNSLPLQPGTADIVFSICYGANKWKLFSSYANQFVDAGVKLHRTAFDIWMEFAAKVGDVKSIRIIDELRSKSTSQHTLTSGFSRAKGHLLEGEPESAAMIIHLLNQGLPDHKKPCVSNELQKLVNEWPLVVVRNIQGEDQKAIKDSLKKGIPAMISSLLTMGLHVPEKLENLKPAILS